MLCLGFERRAVREEGWRAQTNPLSNDGSHSVDL